jgi:hypothetical protein
VRRIEQVGATLVFALLVAVAAFGQGKMRVDHQAVDAGPASAEERAALFEEFLAKWSDYARENYGTDVSLWRSQLGPIFESGDPTNLRSALQRATFESAIATLKGKGHQVSDAWVMGVASQAGDGLAATTLAGQLLGALANDLVYTPIQPCRIIDTRIAGGPIAGGFTRSFRAFNVPNFSSQGGSATDCGTLGQNATAVAINLTAVTPSAPGYATVFPFGTSQPLAASVNYSAGSVVNNAIIAQIPNPVSSFDFTIYTQATSNYVADIVGYFAPPVATALQCTTVVGNPISVGAGAYTSLPTLFCPANYTPVGLAISAGENVLVADTYTAGNAGQIFVRSLSVNAQNVTAKLTCCRVPGR